MGTDFAVPDDYAGPTRPFSKGRGSSRQRPTRHNPARPIADIFVSTGDISSRGRGEERAGRGEQPQGPEERWEEKRWVRGGERGNNRVAARRVRDGDKDDGRQKEDGRSSARRMGPVSQGPGKQKCRRGRVPCKEGRPGGDRRQECGVEWRGLRGNRGICNGGGGNNRRGVGVGKIDADGNGVGDSGQRRGRTTWVRNGRQGRHR